MTLYKPINARKPIKPHSSTRMERIKSVFAAGKSVYFLTEFPNPTPNKPPSTNETSPFTI